MPNNRDGIGTIFINNKNYKGIKVGTSSVKRKYNIPDKNGYTILKIKCSTGSNILNIFNQLTSNVESIEIFNESDININTNTDLPNLNVDNGSTNQYTTWTLPNGNYKVFIKGEFSIKDSTCEILKVKLQNNLTTGYKMFYNCNIVKANSDHGIKIPDSMTNTESMFENSNIDHTAETNLLTITRCSAMYKNCTNLKKIHINYIEAFNNENVLCPNLSESDYNECFAGCGNIRCGNLNSDTNNKPAIFLWDNIPYYWGGLEYSDYIDSSYNYFIVNVNDTNGMSLTLYENPSYRGDLTSYATDWGDGTVDNNSSHTYGEIGEYTIKTKLQSGGNASENNNIVECLNIRNDITNMSSFFYNFKSLVNCCAIPDGIIDMNSTFKYCSSFNQEVIIPDTVTSLLYIFEGCSSFNQPLIIPEGITSLDGILKNCISFNQSVELPSSAAILYFSFYNCKLFNQPITIPESVTSLKSCFQYCSSFNQPIAIPNRVINMGAAFRGCTSFNQSIIIPDTVQYMDQAFYNCTSLNSPITMGTNVINMTGAFYNCSVFNQDIEIPNSVTDLTSMLDGCNSYNSLVTFNLTSTSDQTLNNMFNNSSVSNIKIKGEITNNYMNRILGILVNPTTIDILELSNPNILSIIEDETIMNTINTGIRGTSHTLLWAEPTYNYFIVEPNDTNGLLMNLYENEPTAETVSTLSLSGNQTDWGDGNIDENSTHTYTSGKYLIKTKLQIMNITEYNNYWSNYNGENSDYIEPAMPITKCMSIRKDIDNMDYFFAGPSIHLVHVCEIPDNITSMEGTFANCIEFNQTFNIPNNVTNIGFILIHCNAFNKPLTIPDSVENMMYSFAICHSFNQPVTIPNNVTDCMGLFYTCTSFNQEVILPNKVINIAGMLSGCTEFNQPLVITSSVIQASSLFAGCNVFNQPITIPRSAVNCSGMFMDCVAFNKPITFESGSKIESLRLFLSGCSSFNQPLVIPDGVSDISYLLRGFRDNNRVNMAFNSAITIPDSVTDMSYTFYNCTSFNQPVHISNNCTTMETCFNYCHQFNQPLEIPSSVTNISYGIYNCAKMESKVTFNFNAESTINFDTTSFFSSPIKEVKIKGYCSNDRLINLSDNLKVASATIDIMELSNANILSIIEDSNVKTSIDARGHNLLWKDETYNYFVVQANSTNGMSLTLYENNDKSGDISAYSVDWGDETIDNNSSHTYSSENKYLVKTKLQPCNESKHTEYWDNYTGTNDIYMEPAPIVTKCYNIRNDITDLSCFFNSCIYLTEIPEIRSNITNMAFTFDGCMEFNQPITIPSSVTNLFQTFGYCQKFNQPITIPSNASEVAYMFTGCTNFNQYIEIPSQVITIEGILWGAESFNQALTVPNSVIRMMHAFDGCASLNSRITLGNSITSMQYAFYNCSELTIFPTLPNSVLDAERCFAHASSLTVIDLSYWNPKDIVTMEYMFAMCSSITLITFNQNCSFENLENIHGIFTYCGALTETNLFDILYNQC